MITAWSPRLAVRALEPHIRLAAHDEWVQAGDVLQMDV
jgi:hypothetical protein